MHGWFQKLLKSRVSLSTQPEKEDKETSVSTSSVFTSSFCSSLSSSSSSSSSSPLPQTTLSKPKQPQSALSSPERWNKKYDLLVCHSDADSDIEEAKRLASFLESSPHRLRCFLWYRDVCPGGAVPSEISAAVEDSHLQALLITPNFLKDDWCMYMMLQALAEGPMSNRLIPLVKNLQHSQYPQELRFYFYINLSSNTDHGYSQIHKTVLQYLKDLAKKAKTKDGSNSLEVL
ncbi:toll/interleukin-1 receptor domain-containing adapter protein [Channa argus]|uniref:toll/interleukin-1 receptor domain-containing adapter protein n=1 Tax=Channa argus TaxID=215402 RepID=UPI00351FBF17